MHVKVMHHLRLAATTKPAPRRKEKESRKPTKIRNELQLEIEPSGPHTQIATVCRSADQSLKLVILYTMNFSARHYYFFSEKIRMKNQYYWVKRWDREKEKAGLLPTPPFLIFS